MSARTVAYVLLNAAALSLACIESLSAADTNRGDRLTTAASGNASNGVSEEADARSGMGGRLNSADKSIAVGSYHTCAILGDGTVKCWGRDIDGQLGQEHTKDLGDSAGEMDDDLPSIALGTGRTAKRIAADGNHTCASLDNDTIKCWGLNSNGQLGQKHIENLGNALGEMGNELPAIALVLRQLTRAVASAQTDAARPRSKGARIQALTQPCCASSRTLRQRWDECRSSRRTAAWSHPSSLPRQTPE